MRLHNTYNRNSGFTLVEVLIAVGILLILTGLGLFLSMDLYRGYTFRADEKIFVSILNKARTRSLSNINQYEHGVKKNNDDFVLFQGAGPNLTYATRDNNFDESFPINSRMIIAWPAPSEVVFDQLSGNIDASFLTGDIIITGQGRTATISFNAEGRIDY